MPNFRMKRRLVMRRRVAGLDAATTAWVAAVVSAGGTVSANQQGYVDTLIKAYKAAGVWTLLDREWLYASENAFQASIDIVGLSAHTLVGTPTFTANRGYDSNAQSGYINTGYASGTNFTLNGLSFGGYVFTNQAGSTVSTIMGTKDSAFTYIKSCTAGNNIEFDADESLFLTIANPGANTSGSYIVCRTSSTNIDVYRNAAALGSTSGASSSVSTLNFFVLAYNTAGSPIGTGSLVVSSAFMGGAFNSTQAQAKNAALNNYMASVGANVY